MLMVPVCWSLGVAIVLLGDEVFRIDGNCHGRIFIIHSLPL
jgi:hypothetical protein